MIQIRGHGKAETELRQDYCQQEEEVRRQSIRSQFSSCYLMRSREKERFHAILVYCEQRSWQRRRSTIEESRSPQSCSCSACVGHSLAPSCLSCSSFDLEGPPWAPYASCSLAGRGGIPVVRPLLEHPQMTSELLGKAGEPWPKSELIDLLSPKCGR